jgi:uncharacterized protein YjbI with pentapeptide repeats
MKLQIKHRYTGTILFEAECGDFRACVELAVKSKADLRSANLRSADLRSANLRSANLESADLFSANLRSANLESANLRSANLFSADLFSANLRSADLFSANLRSANLRSADLRSADLFSADLRSANLESANLDKRYISVTGVGSCGRQTLYCIEDDTVWCGCFRGTLEELKARVAETYKDNNRYRVEYEAAIAFFEAVKDTNKK